MNNDVLGAIVGLVFIVFLVCRGLFVTADVANRALKIHGYSEVSLSNRKWFLVGLRGCDMGDTAFFNAKAINPAGEKVKLFVCVGWPFKGATLRTY